MGLFTYILRRLFLAIPMLFGITLVTFLVSHVVPANPLNVVISDQAMENPEIVRAFTKKWGLDKPLPEQYVIYLWRLLQGDMGVSFTSRRPVSQDLAQYLPATIELTIGSMIFAVLLGVPLGVLAALRSNTMIDHIARLISLLGASMPPFWSGLVALYFLYFRVPLFPGPGRLSTEISPPPTFTGLYTADMLLIGNLPGFLDALRHLLLPSIILGGYTLGIIARMTRSSLLEVLRMDYVRTARAKGLRERRVIFIHALRNALIPTVTVIGLAFASLLAGAIMTETVFSWPGVGRYVVHASATLDYPAILGVTLMIAVVYILANLAVDVLYGVLDPRIREGGV